MFLFYFGTGSRVTRGALELGSISTIVGHYFDLFFPFYKCSFKFLVHFFAIIPVFACYSHFTLAVPIREVSRAEYAPPTWDSSSL